MNNEGFNTRRCRFCEHRKDVYSVWGMYSECTILDKEVSFGGRCLDEEIKGVLEFHNFHFRNEFEAV
jgi:hypothetical protein